MRVVNGMEGKRCIKRWKENGNTIKESEKERLDDDNRLGRGEGKGDR